MKKTLVLGASDNPARYSFRAAHMLRNHGHEVVPVGIRKGEVAGLFPCGEGAGYAGGIVSAAMDGERCAEAALAFVAR